MGRKMFEHMLAIHCAPTFSGLKAASLVSFRKSKFEDFAGLLNSYARCFQCKGISVLCIAEGTEYALELFYREKALRELLGRESAKRLLREYGYRVDEPLCRQLEFLRTRMMLRKSFPHEIGIFLGYPPEDVRGFIEHKGQGFCCAGYWKVYANEQETRELFARFTACTEEFCLKLEGGMPFSELLQAV